MVTGHNGQLRALVERIERVEEEIAELNADKSDIYKEAKSNGFDAKIIRKVVAARRKDPSERREEDALFDMYMAAIEGETGLVRARVENIEEIPPGDAEAGRESVETHNSHHVGHEHTARDEGAVAAPSPGTQKSEWPKEIRSEGVMHPPVASSGAVSCAPAESASDEISAPHSKPQIPEFLRRGSDEYRRMVENYEASQREVP